MKKIIDLFIINVDIIYPYCSKGGVGSDLRCAWIIDAMGCPRHLIFIFQLFYL